MNGEDLTDVKDDSNSEFFPMDDDLFAEYGLSSQDLGGSIGSGSPAGKPGFFKTLAKSAFGFGKKLANFYLPDVVDFGKSFVDIKDEANMRVMDEMETEQAKSISKFIEKARDVGGISGLRKKLAESGKKFIKETKEDIKSGNIFLEHEDAGMDMFGSAMDSTYDYDSTSNTEADPFLNAYNKIKQNLTDASSSVNQNKALMSITKKQTNAINNQTMELGNLLIENAKASKQSTMQASVVNKLYYSKTIRLQESMAKNLASLVGFNNSIQKQAIMANLEFQQKSLSIMTDTFSMLKAFKDEMIIMGTVPERYKMDMNEIKYQDVFGNSSLGAGGWTKKVTENIKGVLGNTVVGQLASAGSMMGSASSGMNMGQMGLLGLPGLLMSGKSRMKLDNINNMMGGIWGSLNNKLLDMRTSNSKIKQMLGQAFGVKDYGVLAGGKFGAEKNVKAEFDQVFYDAVVKVIPSYLSKVAAGVTGKEEVHWDYRNGTFRTTSQVKELYEIDKRQALNSDMTTTITKDMLIDITNKQNEKKGIKIDSSIMKKDFEKIYENLAMDDKAFNIDRIMSGDESYITSITNGVKDPRSLQMYIDSFLEMDQKSRTMFQTSLSRAKASYMQFKDMKVDENKDLSSNLYRDMMVTEDRDRMLLSSSNLKASDYEKGTDMYRVALAEENTRRRMLLDTNAGVGEEEARTASGIKIGSTLNGTKNAIDWLGDIYNLLLDGILVFPRSMDESNQKRFAQKFKDRKDLLHKEYVEKDLKKTMQEENIDMITKGSADYQLSQQSMRYSDKKFGGAIGRMIDRGVSGIERTIYSGVGKVVDPTFTQEGLDEADSKQLAYYYKRMGKEVPDENDFDSVPEDPEFVKKMRSKFPWAEKFFDKRDKFRKRQMNKAKEYENRVKSGKKGKIRDKIDNSKFGNMMGSVSKKITSALKEKYSEGDKSLEDIMKEMGMDGKTLDDEYNESLAGVSNGLLESLNSVNIKEQMDRNLLGILVEALDWRNTREQAIPVFIRGYGGGDIKNLNKLPTTKLLPNKTSNRLLLEDKTQQPKLLPYIEDVNKTSTTKLLPDKTSNRLLLEDKTLDTEGIPFDKIYEGNFEIPDIKKMAIDKISGGKDKLSDINDKGFDKIYDGKFEIPDIKKMAIDKISSGKNKISDIKKMAFDKIYEGNFEIPDIKKMAFDKISGGKNKISDIKEMAFDKISDGNGRISDIKRAAFNILSGGKDKLSDIKGTTLDKIFDGKDKLSDIKEMAFDKISDGKDKLSDIKGTTLDKIFDGKNKLSDIKETSLGGIMELMRRGKDSGFLNKIGGGLATGAALLAGGGSKLFSNTTDKTSAMFSAGKSRFNKKIKMLSRKLRRGQLSDSERERLNPEESSALLKQVELDEMSDNIKESKKGIGLKGGIAAGTGALINKFKRNKKNIGGETDDEDNEDKEKGSGFLSKIGGGLATGAALLAGGGGKLLSGLKTIPGKVKGFGKKLFAPIVSAIGMKDSIGKWNERGYETGDILGNIFGSGTTGQDYDEETGEYIGDNKLEAITRNQNLTNYIDMAADVSGKSFGRKAGIGAITSTAKKTKVGKLFAGLQEKISKNSITKGIKNTVSKTLSNTPIAKFKNKIFSSKAGKLAASIKNAPAKGINKILTKGKALIGKGFKFLKDVVVKKFGKGKGAKLLGSLKKFVTEGLEKGIKRGGKTVIGKLAGRFAKVAGKFVPFIGPALLAGDFTTGMVNARQNFDLPKGVKPTWGMRAMSGLVHLLMQNFTFGLIPTDTAIKYVLKIGKLIGIDGVDTIIEGKEKAEIFNKARAEIMGVDPKRLQDWESTSPLANALDSVTSFFGSTKKDKKHAALMGFGNDEAGVERYLKWKETVYSPLNDVYKDVLKDFKNMEDYKNVKFEGLDPGEGDLGITAQKSFRDTVLEKMEDHINSNNLVEFIDNVRKGESTTGTVETDLETEGEVEDIDEIPENAAASVSEGGTNADSQGTPTKYSTSSSTYEYGNNSLDPSLKTKGKVEIPPNRFSKETMKEHINDPTFSKHTRRNASVSKNNPYTTTGTVESNVADNTLTQLNQLNNDDTGLKIEQEGATNREVAKEIGGTTNSLLGQLVGQMNKLIGVTSQKPRDNSVLEMHQQLSTI